MNLKEFNSLPPEERKVQYQEAVIQIKEHIENIEGSYGKRELEEMGHPIKHIFGDGFYLRDMTVPAEQFVVTEMHLKENPLFLMSGSCAIYTEDGMKEVEAPWYTITKPGTQRLILTKEHCNFITVHPSKAKTVKGVEASLIAKGPNDPRFKKLIE